MPYSDVGQSMGTGRIGKIQGKLLVLHEIFGDDNAILGSNPHNNRSLNRNIDNHSIKSISKDNSDLHLEVT